MAEVRGGILIERDHDGYRVTVIRDGKRGGYLWGHDLGADRLLKWLKLVGATLPEVSR